MRFLRTNTAVRVTVGPAVDKADGFTTKDSLTVANLTGLITVDADDNDAVTAQTHFHPAASGSDNDMVSLGYGGMWDLELTQTQTNVLGRLRLTLYDAAQILPIWEDFQVLSANVYDSLFGGHGVTADKLDVNTAEWLGTACATPTVNGVPEVDITHVAGSATTATLDTIKTDTAAILLDTGTDGVVLAADAITAAKIADDAISSEHLATAAITEIQSGLATAAALAAIGSGTGAALNFAVSDDNADDTVGGVALTHVGTETGTYANTLADDTSNHVIASADVAGTHTITWAYAFSCGVAKAASQVTWKGTLSGGVGQADTFTFAAWNGSTWDTRLVVVNTSSAVQTFDIPLLAAHTTVAGLVILRITYAEADAGTLTTNLLLCKAQQSGSQIGYSGGQLWVDTVNGTDAAVPYINGTADNPAKTWANAKSLSSALNMKRFNLSPGSSVTLDAAFTGAVMSGRSYALALGTQNVYGSYFEGVEGLSGTGVIGVGNPEAIFVDCHLSTLTIGEADFVRCHLNGTVTLGQASVPYRFHDCTGIGTNAKIVFGEATQIAVVSGFTGVLTVAGMTSGDTLYIDGNGLLTFDDTNDGGTAYISGNIVLDDSSVTPFVTINDDGRVATDQLTATAGAVTDADIKGIRYRLGLDGTSVQPAALNEAIFDGGLSIFSSTGPALTISNSLTTAPILIKSIHETEYPSIDVENNNLTVSFGSTLGDDIADSEWGKVVAKRRDLFPCGGWTGIETLSASAGVPLDAAITVFWKGHEEIDWKPILRKRAFEAEVIDGETWEVYDQVDTWYEDDAAFLAAIPAYSYLQMTVTASADNPVEPFLIELKPSGRDASDCHKTVIYCPRVDFGVEFNALIRSDGHAVIPYGSNNPLGDWQETAPVEQAVEYLTRAGNRAQCGGWTDSTLALESALPTLSEFSIQVESFAPYKYHEGHLFYKPSGSDTIYENVLVTPDPFSTSPAAIYPIPKLSHLYVQLQNNTEAEIEPFLVQLTPTADLSTVLRKIIFRVPRCPAGKAVKGWAMADGSMLPYQVGGSGEILWDLSKANVSEMIEEGIATESTTGKIETDIAALNTKIGTPADTDIATDIANIAATIDGAGTGSSHDTITVLDAQSNPIADCEVWITTDAAGAIVVAGPLRTEDDGTVEFMLDVGVTYYCWRKKSGVTFTNPVSFVAVGD